jgi:hypothetical protein
MQSLRMPVNDSAEWQFGPRLPLPLPAKTVGGGSCVPCAAGPPARQRAAARTPRRVRARVRVQRSKTVRPGVCPAGGHIAATLRD